MHSSIWNFINQYVSFNTIHWNDLLDVIILSFLLYEIMVWIKKTRAWVLLKGFAVLLVFIFVAWAFRLNTILWLGKNIFSLGITALVIVFQPELRKALEQLGRQNIISSVFNFDSSKETEARFSDKTVNELVKAVFEDGQGKDRRIDCHREEDAAERV